MSISPVNHSISERIEDTVKKTSIALLPSIIDNIGFRCKLQKFEANDQSDVYGTYSGTKTSDDAATYIKILMNGGMWRSISSYESGWLDDQGTVYSNYPVENNDIITIVRTDSTKARFKVTDTESIGHTTNIIKRFKLSNLGD